MDKEEFKVRLAALERLNSTLLRITRENANKARKRPRKASGYVFKAAEERQERVLTNPGGIFRPELKYSDPVRCWKIIFETPYSVEMDPEDVKTAISCDFERYGIQEPLQEPVIIDNINTISEQLRSNSIFRILLKRQAEGYWQIAIYSTCFISFSDQDRKAIREGLQEDPEDCILENESEDEFEVSIVGDPNEGGFIAYYPDLPGCITSGETLEEVKKNAEDAKKAWFEARKEE